MFKFDDSFTLLESLTFLRDGMVCVSIELRFPNAKQRFSKTNAKVIDCLLNINTKNSVPVYAKRPSVQKCSKVPRCLLKIALAQICETVYRITISDSLS
jgi:hypothetical protein